MIMLIVIDTLLVMIMLIIIDMLHCSSLRSSLAGRQSILKEMSEEVVSVAYMIDQTEAREVMRKKEQDTLILPPSSTRPSPRHQWDIIQRVQVK
jgi:hypothetical protein